MGWAARETFVASSKNAPRKTEDHNQTQFNEESHEVVFGGIILQQEVMSFSFEGLNLSPVRYKNVLLT